MSKRKQITTEDKYYAILQLEKKESNQQTIANEFGINKATVCRWMGEATRVQIKKAYEENNVRGDRKKLRSSKYSDLQSTLF